MGRRKAVVNQDKSGVTREGMCSESGNIFTIAALSHKRKWMYEVLEPSTWKLVTLFLSKNRTSDKSLWLKYQYVFVLFGNGSCSLLWDYVLCCQQLNPTRLMFLVSNKTELKILSIMWNLVFCQKVTQMLLLSRSLITLPTPFSLPVFTVFLHIK